MSSFLNNEIKNKWKKNKSWILDVKKKMVLWLCMAIIEKGEREREREREKGCRFAGQKGK